MPSVRYVVVGGGIVGLATAHQLVRDFPDATVTVVEKERTWGAHQTGIVDFGAVCVRLAELLDKAGARLCLGSRVTAIRSGDPIVVGTTGGEIEADVLVNCAGLYADRVARLAGVVPPVRIVPFRGE